MKHNNVFQRTLLPIFLLILFCTQYSGATSITNLKEGEFIFTIKEGQYVFITANKAKLSDIIKLISEKMNIEIALTPNRAEELVTTESSGQLEIVLKNIIKDNYAMVVSKSTKNNFNVEKSSVASSSSSLNSDTKKTKTINPYNYPIRPGMKEWENLSTIVEMYQATQIPKNILKSMNTRDLVETSLNYPLRINALISESMSDGINILMHNFNGLEELINRKDSWIALMEEYRSFDPGEIVKKQGKWTEDQQNDFIGRASFLELIISQKSILDSMPPPEKHALVKEALEKFYIKTQYPDYYGFMGLSSCALIMKQAIVTDSSTDHSKDVDEDNIEKVLADATRFLEIVK